MSLAVRRTMIERGNEKLPTKRQCRLLGVSRSTYYHQPKGPSAADLELMAQIDLEYLKTPFYGSRKMAKLLGRLLNRPINRKRVRRLMRRPPFIKSPIAAGQVRDTRYIRTF